MASLKADFDELIRRIETGREFAHASFEPIFYLVFPPSELLEAKRLIVLSLGARADPDNPEAV